MPRTLVTSALPYANGPIHLGHMVEHVQMDIYVRFLRSCGEDVVCLCADDTHGTPIELKAAEKKMSPEDFVKEFWEQHQKDFADFGVQYDCYWTTHSPENRHYAELIYKRLKEAGDIETREIEQTFCEHDQRFLPDRFVRGVCPSCKAPDQYGDVCEVCNKAYTTAELIDPFCALCRRPPTKKKSSHLFFKLSRHEAFLKETLRRPGFIDQGVANQLKQFFDKGLADWDISRDGPYFGFPIPGETNKFFYVWLDAPIGYIAATERWAKVSGRAPDALAYWGHDSDARIVHFIGKDIVYFHALFWPAMLNVARLRLPQTVHVHGHLTVNGAKMSKTRGTFINARAYLDVLDPSYLRFFYASNLGPGPEDLDLSLTEFRHRVNAQLVDNIGNLANRTLSLLAGPLGGKLAAAADGPGRALVESSRERIEQVRKAYGDLDYRLAVKHITEIAHAANQFVTAQEPWKKVRADAETARRDLSDAADVVALLAALLAPVVPRVSERLFKQLGIPALTFEMLAKARYPVLGRSEHIEPPAPIIKRLEEPEVAAMLAAPAQASAPAAATQDSKDASGQGTSIEYADFAKVALKAGKVLAAERIPKADKLLKLSVDVGEPSPRTIVAGIAEAYSPESVAGRRVVVVTNLKPRALRGVESNGMLLAAGAGKELALVDPGPANPGTDVK